MKSRIEAVRMARRWLLSLSVQSEDQYFYRESAISLCENIIDNITTFVQPSSFTLTGDLDVVKLVEMSREDIIQLSRAGYNSQFLFNNFDLTVSQLAASYARMDDLQAVAALLRITATYGISDIDMADVWNYVLSQQNSNGSFGLLSAEIMLLKGKNWLTPYLMMTSEVLHAIGAAENIFCNTDNNIIYKKNVESVASSTELLLD